MATPDSESCRRKESRTPPIGNPKTQENQHPPPAFLQNRILDQLKSQRQINRFRILHRRRQSPACRSGQPSSGSTPHDRTTIPQNGSSRSLPLDRPRQSALRYPAAVANRPPTQSVQRDPPFIRQPLRPRPTR